MGTLFTDVYSQAELIKNDNRLKLKPSNMVYKLYYDYLKYSIGLFQRDCYKDLKNHIPFTQNEYMFIVNGIDNQFSIANPIPLTSGKWYVGYSPDNNTAYVEITSDKYTIDFNNNILTINLPIITANSIVYVSNYNAGEFVDDLDYDEILILSEGILIPYLKEQQNRNSLLTHMVYAGSMKASSQGEHIKQIHTVVKDQESLVRLMIKEYSYSANPQNLIKLGGGN